MSHDDLVRVTPKRLEQIREVVDKVSYARGFAYQFAVSEDGLLITFTAVDSCAEGITTRDFEWHGPFPDELRDCDDHEVLNFALRWVFAELAASEVHEVGEFFHFGEARPFDPHVTGTDGMIRGIPLGALPWPMVSDPAHPWTEIL